MVHHRQFCTSLATVICAATFLCLTSCAPVNGTDTDTAGSAITLVAGLASLRVTALLEGLSLVPTTQVLLDTTTTDLRNSSSLSSNFSCSVPVSADAPLVAVIFEVEFLNPQSNMSIVLSSPDLPQDILMHALEAIASSRVQHTEPEPPSVRHTYTLHLMLLAPVLLAIRPSLDVIPITLQFTLSVFATADPSVHREYGVGVVALIQPTKQSTTVLSVEGITSQQSITVLPSYNSSWVSNVTFANVTAPSLVISRDAVTLLEPSKESNTSAVDRGVSVWQQTFDIFLSNSVFGPVATKPMTSESSNNSVTLRFEVATQLRVPYPSLWLPLLPLQAERAANGNGQAEKVTAKVARCARDAGDDVAVYSSRTNSSVRLGSSSLEWDFRAIEVSLFTNPNASTILLQTSPTSLEIEVSFPAAESRTFVILRCTAFTFNFTNLTHSQAYRLEWQTQIHVTKLDQRDTSSSTSTALQQGSSSGTSTAATNNLSSTGSTGSPDGSNGAGNETDGGSTTLGVFSGLAVFTLAGFRIWLDFKDRRGNQLLRSLEQPQAGSQL